VGCFHTHCPTCPYPFPPGHIGASDSRQILQPTSMCPSLCLLQRFQQALFSSVDSLNLEQEEAAADASNSSSNHHAPPQLLGRQASMDGAMSKEWGAFMNASKVVQVKDVWDLKGADEGGPRATKKQLEEMTARFRAASGRGASLRVWALLQGRISPRVRGDG
jgi:hypothetical protein